MCWPTSADPLPSLPGGPGGPCCPGGPGGPGGPVVPGLNEPPGETTQTF